MANVANLYLIEAYTARGPADGGTILTASNLPRRKQQLYATPFSPGCATDAVSTTISKILQTTRRLSARVHTLEAIKTELTERLELLESDDQPTVQGYSPDNRSPTEAEMTVLLPPTEINKRGNKTEAQLHPKQQKQKQHQSRDPSPSKRDRRCSYEGCQEIPRLEK